MIYATRVLHLASARLRVYLIRSVVALFSQSLLAVRIAEGRGAD
jgi:hypothetical protein